LSYFVFDHVSGEAIKNHVEHLNDMTNNTSRQINNEFVVFLKNQLLISNHYCRDLQFIGSVLQQIENTNENQRDTNVNQTNEQIFRNLTARLRNQVSYFDVAHMTNDRANGILILHSNSPISYRYMCHRLQNIIYK